MTPKVAVIGLDGATMKLVEPLTEKGKLPVMGELMKTGSFGTLKSTIPYHSAPGWVSAVTGKNPGKHGIYQFAKFSQGQVRLASSIDVKSDTVWDLLSKANKRSIVVNVPMSYPPRKINGVLVSGMLAPSVKSDFTYPSELKHKLIRMGYEIELDSDNLYPLLFKDKIALFERFLEIEEKRIEASLYLLENYGWDFFMLVLTAPDRIAHYFWRFANPKDPLFEASQAKKYGHLLEQSYIECDKLIGRVLEYFDSETSIMIMSDHGSGPVHKNFHINSHLKKLGLISYKNQGNSIVSSLVNERVAGRLLSWLPTMLGRAVANLGLRLRPAASLGMKVGEIEFSKTKAYALPSGFLQINVRGREPHGTVAPGHEYEHLRNSLIESYESLKDPENGENIVKKVHKRENLYWGSYVLDAPDLVIETNYTYYASSTIDQDEVLDTLQGKINGDHQQDGMLILGPGFQTEQKIRSSQIWDVAPTILGILNVPIPSDLDGINLAKKSSHVFEPEGRQADLWVEMELRETDQPYTISDEDRIAERLRRLGYL